MFNSLSKLPTIPYNILIYLAQSADAEDIWKMLAYSSYDALSKPNLSMEEKTNLIWKNGSQEKFSVFLTPLIEDEITESKSIMKIYDYYIQPNNLFSSAVTYAFDFLYGGNMSMVEYEGTPVSRGDLFIHKILSVLNGADVGGVGRLSFSDDISRYDVGKATIGNSRSFTGVQLYLSVNVGDAPGANDCAES